MSAAEEVLHLARRSAIRQTSVEETGPPFIDGEFAHKIAHDIRSPLTVIQMCAETMMTDDDEALRVKYCGIILGQTKALAWRLEDLVTLADEDAWTQGERLPMHLGELVRECLADMGPTFSERVVALPSEPASGRHRANVARAAMQQAVRCCVLALFHAAPSTSDCLSIGLFDDEDGTVAPGHVAIRLVLVPDQPGDGRRSRCAPPLPWDHLSLMSAARVVGAHGGLLSEVCENNCTGIQIMLPAGHAPS